MSRLPPTKTDTNIEGILDAIRDGGHVRRRLAGGGRIFLDRPLPFLCIYRRPENVRDDVMERLISTESSYIIIPKENKGQKHSSNILAQVAAELSAQFESLLLIEIWEATATETNQTEEDEAALEATYPPPTFTIYGHSHRQPVETITTLRRVLSKQKFLRQTAVVQPEVKPFSKESGRRSSISLVQCKRMNIYSIGLEIGTEFRDRDTGEVFPGMVRRLRRSVERAINQASFAFARAHTNIEPKHYYTLGRRTFVKAVWEVDHKLAEVESSFDMILQATPVNSESAWLEFRRSKFEKAPRFLYRPLPIDTAELKRKLYSVPLERIEDTTIAHMLRSQQDDIDRHITMLRDIGTYGFRYGSCQVFGTVSKSLSTLARDIFQRLPKKKREKNSGTMIDAEQFASFAREEVARYRMLDSEFKTEVKVCDDFYSGLMVSGGNLLIGHQMRIPRSRVESLIAHEVGVHCLTWHNGKKQPLRQLSSGLPGYNDLQEGIAVLAEYFSGGITKTRMRLLAARVIAVEAMLDGATFVDTFRMLNKDYGFSQKLAYTITMRIYRGGGLTKDAVYLRGLAEAFMYLREGGDFEPLWTGKISVDHVPMITELRLRGVLKSPSLRPRFLTEPHFAERLQRLRRCESVIDLVDK